jgi:hypothetical protein
MYAKSHIYSRDQEWRTYKLMVNFRRSWQVQKCACSNDTVTFEEESNPIGRLVINGTHNPFAMTEKLKT